MPDEAHSKSGDGRFVIRINPWEARMSLWVETPSLYDMTSNEPLLTFRNSNWSLDHASWDSGSGVTLTLRKYPGDHTPPSVTVTIDCLTRTATVAGKSVKSLDAIEAALEAAISPLRR